LHSESHATTNSDSFMSLGIKEKLCHLIIR
jgi:hypothetical protein